MSNRYVTFPSDKVQVNLVLQSSSWEAYLDDEDFTNLKITGLGSSADKAIEDLKDKWEAERDDV